MAHRAKDIEHFAQLGLQGLEHALGGFRGLSISNRCNKSHDDLLWKSTAGVAGSGGSLLYETLPSCAPSTVPFALKCPLKMEFPRLGAPRWVAAKHSRIALVQSTKPTAPPLLDSYPFQLLPHLHPP